MRELKFRAWDKIEKKMVPVLSINWGLEIVFLDYDFPNKPHSTWKRKFEDIELVQFTGLQDKNGEEIYEGDIVKNFYRGKTYIIEWDEEITGFTQREKDTYMHFFMDWAKEKETKYNLEVIGNVHESPKLLERGVDG